jgi:hypothetical protein
MNEGLSSGMKKEFKFLSFGSMIGITLMGVFSLFASRNFIIVFTLIYFILAIVSYWGLKDEIRRLI